MLNPNYIESFELPAWEAPIWEGSKDDRTLANDGAVKWSGDAVPPDLESTVTVYCSAKPMQGTVCAYFVEYNWLGVLVALKNPPQWWIEQNDGKNPPFHAFGIDLKKRTVHPSWK